MFSKEPFVSQKQERFEVRIFRVVAWLFCDYAVSHV